MIKEELSCQKCKKIEALDAELEQLKVQYEWLKRQMFGSKSERFIPNDLQYSLDLDVKPVEVEIKKETLSYERKITTKTNGHHREAMPAHLPIRDTRIEPKEDISGCKHIGDEITWEYEYEPGTLRIHRFIRPKYAYSDNSGVVVAALPERAIEKGNFSPSIMSAITTDKYVYHIPLFRQIKKFKDQYKVEFAESTFCDIIKRTTFWIEPVYTTFKIDLLKSDYIQADETYIPVLITTKRGKVHKGYYWVYYDPLRKIVIFEYCHSRKQEHPHDFLKEFKGILQTDGYAGYNSTVDKCNIMHAACMDHVRRYFEKALDSNAAKAGYALEIIQQWYMHEAVAKKEGYSFEQRLAMRHEHIQEPMEKFRIWCVEQITKELPQNLLRKTCEYALGQWDGFKPYLTDGRIEISTIRVENLIRPVAIGRKNYMFKGSEEGARRGAIIYSIVGTAQLHGKNPRENIKELLTELPMSKNSDIRKFLPY